MGEVAIDKLVNLTGHDDDAGLPCLCKQCLPTAPETATASDMRFIRQHAIVGDRVLHFWSLAELAGERRPVRDSVERALAARLAATKRGGRR